MMTLTIALAAAALGNADAFQPPPSSTSVRCCCRAGARAASICGTRSPSPRAPRSRGRPATTRARGEKGPVAKGEGDVVNFSQ